MDELELLRNGLNKIKFLKGIMEMPRERISGSSFFPCGSGLYKNSTNRKSVMVLGQDQDNERGFSRSMKTGNESNSATWRNIKELFNKAQLNLQDCFFTNCIMGLRIDSKRNVGKSPGLLNEKFLRQNIDYLKYQIQIIKPNSIVVLGLIPLKFLSMLSKELRFKTIFLEKFKEIDENNMGYLSQIQFENLDKIDVGILVHPSYRIKNCQHRKFNGYTGNMAEIEILKNLNNTGSNSN